MKKMDILFVHPNGAAAIYQSLAKDHSAIEPPIWAALLANSVRSRGFNTCILDAEAEQLTIDEVVDKIIDIDARVVCFVVYGQQPSASSQNMVGACDAAKSLKDKSPTSFVLFVGGHVSALPKETLEAEKYIDAVCQNEGVYTIHDLLQVENLNEDSYLNKVNGLGFRNQSGEITLTPPSTVVKNDNLEKDLPGMAWDLLPDFHKYRTAGWHSWSNNSVKKPFAALYTSLGCPYRCSFCMINIINRTDPGIHISSADSNIYRKWSPEFIIKQFEIFANAGVKNIKIADELFVLNPNHFIKICNLIIERGYDFNIWAYSRIDTCKPKYLDTLRKAGVKWLGLGIENPDALIRKEIHKDGFKNVKIVDLIQLIHEAGINVAGNYIFGLPNDTMEGMQNTLDFANENLTEMANFYCAMAYPGSPLYNSARKTGLELPKVYSGYSQHSYETLNLRTDNLSSAEILKFRDNAWHEYHSNPRYLELVKKTFGQPAVKNITETLDYRLKRRILGD